MSISINPFVTTNAYGTFSTQSDGYVQGEFLDDPAIRFQLVGGPLATAETLPMWGGVAISETTDNSGTIGLGGAIARASAEANLTGFSVFSQAYAWVQTPQSPVPLAANGQTIPFFRLGSNARIPVACDPTLAASLASGLINQQVAWDFTNQVLIAYTTGTALPVKVVDVQIGNSKIVAYDPVTGFATWTNTGSVAVIQI